MSTPPTAAAAAAEVRNRKLTEERKSLADVVVVGAGIGGLCCGALLAKYGLKVTVRVVGGPSAC